MLATAGLVAADPFNPLTQIAGTVSGTLDGAFGGIVGGMTDGTTVTGGNSPASGFKRIVTTPA
ncbi:uncharacterized protein L969DRAFT_16310 [Mixia osmundae IAM 14324]|nr:uncharacterized protein L969DRAFT_16310 [Mixia osmundae IAM 14324]KEI40959.1 hypothetical protein L969DRAFT_16310 [Mixia osmundae IAM 14324]